MKPLYIILCLVILLTVSLSMCGKGNCAGLTGLDYSKCVATDSGNIVHKTADDLVHLNDCMSPKLSDGWTWDEAYNVCK
jgi:hypothetical protein